MNVITLEVKKKNIPIDWLSLEERNKNPDVVFKVSIEEVKTYTPKEYPNNIKQIVQEAKQESKQREKQGFSREQSFKEFFKIQEKISNHIKNKQGK